MKTYQILKKYSEFRNNMGVPIEKKTVEKFWSIENIDELKKADIEISDIKNPFIKEKINIAKNSIRYLRLFNWVKFIAISGSVASSFAEKEDDIDIFVIVKNDRAWIYRGLILFQNIFHRKIRVGDSGRNVKDKLCLNFITEERSLDMESDIFNLNEIISLVSIYKQEYFNILLEENSWLFSDFNISRNIIKGGSIKKGDQRRYKLLSIFNYIFFLPQLFYMKILRHNPDYERLVQNFKKGRIEFFRKDFKREKLNNLE